MRIVVPLILALSLAPAPVAAADPCDPGLRDAFVACATGHVELLPGGPSAALGARAASRGPLDCGLDDLDDRCESWTATVTHAGGTGPEGLGYDEATAMALAANGEHLYMIGRTFDDASGSIDYQIAALHADGGGVRWTSRYAGDGGVWDAPYGVVVAPDGAAVFVTGIRDFEAEAAGDFTTIAYDAATGDRKWVATYDGPAGAVDAAYEIAVSPGGDEVYVGGVSRGVDEYDFAVVAYDAATGDERWVSRYDGPTHGRDHLTDMVLSPDGSRLFVTGHSDFVLATVAYVARDEDPDDDLEPGDEAWIARNGGAETGVYGVPIAIDADVEGVYVSGWANPPGGGGADADVLTLGLDAGTGAERWTARHRGPTGGFNAPNDVLVAAGTLYVAGTVSGETSADDRDFGVVAYEVAGGTQRWAARHGFPGADLENANALALSADTLYVTGQSWGSLHAVQTLALSPETGTRSWVAWFNTSPLLQDVNNGYLAATAPDGTLLVGGTAMYAADLEQPVPLLGGDYSDFLLLAYEPG